MSDAPFDTLVELDPRDRVALESQRIHPASEPYYDFIKGCLIWSDERPGAMTRLGYEFVVDLWEIRANVHRGIPLSETRRAQHLQSVWEYVRRTELNWIGLERLHLSAEEKKKWLVDMAQEAMAAFAP